MATEVYAFDITIPAGTLKAAGFSYKMSMRPRIVREIDIRIPAGPSGNVGFQIGAAGTQIIPQNTGEYIIADDERIQWQIDNAIDSGAWVLYGYNTGTHDHTIYVQFQVDLISASGQDLSIPLNI